MKEKAIDFKKIRGAIFDMDGTMVDNTVYHRQAWIEFLGRHGFQLERSAFDERLLGRNTKEILQSFFPNVSNRHLLTYEDEKERTYMRLYGPHIKPLPGLLDLIRELKATGVRIAVATTAPKANRDFVLDRLRLADCFEVVVGAEHVVHSKPAPDIFLLAAERLRVKPSSCLAFEDTRLGVKAAKAAGMQVIGIATYQSQIELEEADMIIHDFSDLLVKHRGLFSFLEA